MSQPALAIRSLCCTLADKVILNDIALSLAPGDLCCLIGPNGAGKSTLLKCIAQLHDAWHGTVAVQGRDTRSLSRRDLARSVAYVPQLHGHLPEYSVGEFLQLSRFAHGDAHSRHARTLARDALARVGLPDAFAERRLPTLSGGECRRVFIAAALVQEAPLLLLDEPGAFLDPSALEDIYRLLDDLHRDGTHTILCVSHDLNVALLHATVIAALRHGQLVFTAAPAAIRPHQQLDALFDTAFDYVAHPKSGQAMTLPSPPANVPET